MELIASDHRNGAFGDSHSMQVESIEAGHRVARELNCGIYTLDGVIYESDGEIVTRFEPVRDAVALTTNAHAYADTINADDVMAASESAMYLTHLLGNVDTRERLQDVLDVDYGDLALALGYVAALVDLIEDRN